MNPIPALTPHLKRLRLSGILDSLESRNRQAIDAKLAYTEFLALLIEDEAARREQKKYTSRLRRAAFRTGSLKPQLRRADRGDIAARTGADNDEVVVVGVGHSKFLRDRSATASGLRSLLLPAPGR